MRHAAAVLPLACLLFSVACSTTGPHRPTLTESVHALVNESTPPAETAPPESSAHSALAPEEPEPPPAVEPTATPFSAGLMLGVGLHLDGSRRLLPAQLAVGSLKVAAVKGRAVNLLALGGISSTDIQSARAAWGLGASFELTPGTLPYEVDLAAGALWVAGEASPAGIVGFTLTPKM